eukprot:1603193-Pleurochrysis_carterae.AAC.1
MFGCGVLGFGTLDVACRIQTFMELARSRLFTHLARNQVFRHLVRNRLFRQLARNHVFKHLARNQIFRHLARNQVFKTPDAKHSLQQPYAARLNCDYRCSELHVFNAFGPRGQQLSYFAAVICLYVATNFQSTSGIAASLHLLTGPVSFINRLQIQSRVKTRSLIQAEQQQTVDRPLWIRKIL